MLKNSKKGKLAIAVMSMAMAAAPLTAVPAFAANGVQAGTQHYADTDASGEMAWDGDGQGDIDITYDTTNGNWQDPGDDPTKTDDNKSHKNGTYMVTIPTAITYENMAIGNVSTDDNYTVNVRGSIPADQAVTLTAETGKDLTINKDGTTRKGDINETTTQGKTKWSADECYGKLNEDGSLAGTDATDNIKLNGTAKVAGSYQGSVGYTSSLGASAGN